MHLETKQKIVALFDAAAAGGAVGPWTLSMHPDTARAAGLHATHVDLGNERLFPHEDAIHAELTHPDYNPLEGKGPGRPLESDAARALAKSRCQARMRRPGVVLEVKLDASMAPDKIRVTGVQPTSMEA